MKRYICFLLLLLIVHPSIAALTPSEIEAIGQFLLIDVAVLPDGDHRSILGGKFLAKDTGKGLSISESESRLHGAEGILSPGKYRFVQIITEIDGIGSIIRHVYLDANEQVFWAHEWHSLINLKLRPELGNTGVVRLMDYSVEDIISLLKDSQVGTIPKAINVSQEKKEFFKKALRAFQTVIQNRP